MSKLFKNVALAAVFGGVATVANPVARPFAAFAAAQDEGRIERQFKVSPGSKLRLDLKTGGSIDILGSDQSDVVSIVARLGGRDGRDCKLDFAESASGLEVSSRYDGERHSYSSNIQLEIRVPKRFNLELDSMGGGVRIAGVEGTIEGQTMGGALDLSNLKGHINLSTMGGPVTLTGSDVDGHVQTMGGRVLIQDVTGDVEGSTMGGKVVYKNVTNRAGILLQE